MGRRDRRFLWALGIGIPMLSGGIAVVVAQEAIVTRVAKVVDIFTALVRSVLTQYVEPVDPELLLEAGAEAMLKQLDPYSRYIDEEGSDELDILSTGSYTGIGIVAALREDSLLTVVEVHENSDAWRAGVRVGDRLYQIDSVVVLRLPARQLRRYTRGEPGTTVRLVLLRERLTGGYDTLRLIVRREEIRLPAVTLAQVVNDTIGYVRLERFSRRAVQEVQQAWAALRQRALLRGIILDVRDNPGGLLDVAVNICGLFVPANTPLVTVRGRDSQNDRVYYAYVSPQETELPLAVLINGGSASASEIIAAVLQDLDRALIVGTPSVGKGLVQSVLSLPHGTVLRLTTARYYTPSGRTVQKLAVPFVAHKASQETSRPFATRNGRIVFGNAGVQPDVVVEAEDSLPEALRWLQREGWLFRFATAYAAQYERLPDGFRVTPKVIAEFENFLIAHGKAEKLYPVRAALTTLLEHARHTESPTLLRQVERLADQLRQQERSLLVQHQEHLLPLLEREILARFLPAWRLKERFLLQDVQLMTAARLIGSQRYYQILAISPAEH